jgi:hypothetical protein
LNQARRRDRERHQQRCPAHSPPWERARFLGITVVVMAVMMSAMTVIVASVVIVIVCVRLAQLAAPG